MEESLSLDFTLATTETLDLRRGEGKIRKERKDEPSTVSVMLSYGLTSEEEQEEEWEEQEEDLDEEHQKYGRDENKLEEVAP